MGEELKKYLREEGYKYLNAGHSKEGLGQYLSECRNNYQNNSENRQQASGSTDNSSNASSNVPIIQPIIIEQKSGFDFWDIMLLSYLSGCGRNTTNIHNYAPDTNRKSNESDNSVLGPCIAAFCLIFATVASYFLLSYAAYKIKNAKLENNKYSVPSAIGLGIFSFSVSATLILLLSGMIVPNLERTMGISSGAFTGFQVITGLNAIIFGLGAVLFVYLAIDKANKKALVDREVDLIISCGRCSPSYGTSGSQYGEQQPPQNEQYQMGHNQQYPSAPPSYTEWAEPMHSHQPRFSGYNPGYQFQSQSSQQCFNNPNTTSHNFSQDSPPPPKY